MLAVPPLPPFPPLPLAAPPFLLGPPLPLNASSTSLWALSELITPAEVTLAGSLDRLLIVVALWMFYLVPDIVVVAGA